MKVCSYCGRENDDGTTCCRECGTPFPTEFRDQPPEPPSEAPISRPSNLLLGVYSVLVVEGPFFCTSLIMQSAACRHCRELWLAKWPLLPALVPSFLMWQPIVQHLRFIRKLPEWLPMCIAGGGTIGIIGMVFVFAWARDNWRLPLAAGLFGSIVLAYLTRAMLAA